MPEEIVIAAIAEIGAAIGGEAGAVAIMYAGEIYTGLQVAAFATAVYTSRESQRKQQNAARDSYNASLKDRYTMVRSAVEPRRVVLGRQRVSGPLAYIGSYGTDREHLVFVVILAAHQIDAVEAIYFDDEQVVLDGSGNVLAVNRRDLFTLSATGDDFTLTSAPAAGTVVAVVDYGSTRVVLGTSMAGSVVTVSGGTSGLTGTVTISYQPEQSPWIKNAGTNEQTSLLLDGAGNGSLTLPDLPVPGSVHVVYSTGFTVEDRVDVDLTSFTTVVGSLVTVAGGTFDATCTVTWQGNANATRARVRQYLGAAGQTADAAMVAALPDIWTTSHTLTGLAYLVVECDYDVDAFPGGLFNVSAQVRGALLYDPRDATTAWSENPALMMRHVATHPLLGRLSTAQINDASGIVAANVCDEQVAYVVQGQTYTRALYTASLTAKSGTRAKDALDDLSKAMAGRWAFTGGELRVKAGGYTTPLQALDDTWLSGRSSVQVQVRANRGDVFNVVTGRIADQQRDYAEVDYPRVESATYIAEDGAELALDMPLNAVTFVGQAQQVAAATLRDARQGLRVVLSCNMRAWPVEVFDTLTVTLARFGWAAKVFEVLAVSWQLDGGIQLTLKETDATVWALGTSFGAQDPAPNTLFPSPFKLPAITGLACASGTAQLLHQADGTVQTRVLVTWDTIVDPLVLNDGGVELRYGLATDAETTWRSVTAPRTQAQIYLTNDIRDGLLYLVKARAFNALVKGAWCVPVLHAVVGKTAAPGNVAGLAGTVANGRITWVWTPCAEADYGTTEVRSTNSNWGSTASPPLFRGAASSYAEAATTAGSVTRYARHIDTSGNPSATSASAAVTVATADLVDARLAAALADAAAAQATADGKIDTFWQATAPASGMAEGDLWFDTDDGAKQYRYTSGVWTVAADTRIGQAISDASDAQATADGKVTTFVATTAPTAEGTGDLWLDSDDGNKLYRWSGSAWAPLVVGTGALAADAATEIYQDLSDGAGAALTTGEVTLITMPTITPSVAGVIELTATVDADNLYGDAGNWCAWWVSLGGGSDAVVTAGSHGGFTASRGIWPVSTSFAVDAGVSVVLKLKARKDAGAGAPHLWQTSSRVTLIKR